MAIIATSPESSVETAPGATASVRSLIYVVLLASLAAYFLAWPIWRAQFLVEIWPTEGWNAYLQDAAATGRRLYPSADDLTGNNYPPLSFYAVGYLGKIFGDNLFVGRALSIVALFCVAGEIFLAVRVLTISTLGGFIGALWYVAIMARNSTTYVGTNDPQIAGEAIMGAALVWLLSRYQEQKSPLPPLLLMVLAGFWKHNMIAIPIATIAWLLYTNARQAAFPVLFSAVAAMAAVGVCAAVFGSDFLWDMLAVRQYGWSNVLGNVGHLQWSAAAFVIWLLWAISDRHSSAARFTMLLVGTGLFACILQWFGHGVSGNAEFDLIIGLGIGIGVAFARIRTSWLANRIGVDRARDVLIAILLLRLVLVDRQETALLLLSPDFRAALHDRQTALLKEAVIVSKIDGDVACSNKVVCRVAGKRFIVDEFKMEELVATGRVTTAAVAAMLANRRITSFVNAAPTRINIDTSFSSWLVKRSIAQRGVADVLF